MSWEKTGRVNEFYSDERKYPKSKKVIDLAIFDLYGTTFFTNNDSKVDRKVKPEEIIVGYYNSLEMFQQMYSDDWYILFVAKSVDQNITFPEEIKWILSGNSLDICKKISGLKLSDASFYCHSFDPFLPSDYLKSTIDKHSMYRGWEIFDKFPIGDSGPSIRDEGPDLIVLVGSSGSGRDEAVEYLKDMDYIEVRRQPRDGHLKTISNELKRMNRVVFNATNPSVDSRKSVLKLHDSARIWWFARPGREFTGQVGKAAPEIAYRNYTRDFEEPTKSRDKVPVIRLT